MEEKLQEDKAFTHLSQLLKQAREQRVTGEVVIRLRLNAGGIRGIRTITETEVPNSKP